MTGKKIKHLIRICPYKEEPKKDIEEQKCCKYNNMCSENIKNQTCERFKRLMMEEMQKKRF